MIKYHKLKFYERSSPLKVHLVTETLLMSMNFFVQCFQIPKLLKNFRFDIEKCLMLFHMILEPYFRDQLIKDIKNCQRFARCFDEQTNNQNKKQLDLYFRY